MADFFGSFTDLPVWSWIVFFSILGLCFGSFANVVIYRLPAQLSVVSPRSRCPQCNYQLKWYDNIPILSWCLLLGKCRKCGASISYRYPLVELLCGVFFVFTYLKLGICWTLLEYQIFAFSLLVVSFIDFDHYILPDVFTLSGIVIGLLGALINPERQFMDSLYGVLMGGGFLWAIAYVYWLLRKQEGMGGGDIKLLAWIGAVVGWQSIAFVILVSSILGGLVGIVVGIQKKEGLQSTIPFGPYLALGALLYIWVGEELTNWYLNLFIPGIA